MNWLSTEAGVVSAAGPVSGPRARGTQRRRAVRGAVTVVVSTLCAVMLAGVSGAPATAASVPGSDRPSPSATGAWVAEAPPTVTTVLAERAFPAVHLIRTDYTATVRVAEPQLNMTAVQALFGRLLRQAQSGVIDGSQSSVLEAVTTDIVRTPLAYFEASKRMFSEPGQATGWGTGWVITPDGHVVTAAHVVSAELTALERQFAVTTLRGMNDRFAASLADSDSGFTPEQIKRLSAAVTTWLVQNVTVTDVTREVSVQVSIDSSGSKRTRAHPATVIAVGEPFPGKDVALLKADGLSAMPTLPLGDDADVTTGSTLFVVGYPAASTFLPAMSVDSQAQPTVTQGPLSALKSTKAGMPVFQTQAPASPGNSGGPVMNERGTVVGVLVAGAAGPDGEAVAGQEFVVPVSVVREQLTGASVTATMSRTSIEYDQALDAYHKRHYSAALTLFRSVQTQYRDHAYVADYIARCQAAIAAGGDQTPLAPQARGNRWGWLPVAGGVGFLFMAAAGAAALLLARRSRQQHASALGQAAAWPWPPPPPPGQGGGHQGGPAHGDQGQVHPGYGRSTPGVPPPGPPPPQ